MPSAVERLPCHIIELMNFVTRSDLIDGIGRDGPLCDMSFTRHKISRSSKFQSFKVPMFQAFVESP